MCDLGSRFFFTLLFLDWEKKYSRNLTLTPKFFEVPLKNLASSGSWQEIVFRLLCDVISVFSNHYNLQFVHFEFHWRAKQAQISFRTEYLIIKFFLDVITNVTQNRRALHRIPFFKDHRPEWVKRRKKWIDFAIPHCLCWFRGRIKPCHKSKLDFILLYCRPWAKKTPNFLALKGCKIRRKNARPKTFSPK